MACAMSSLGRVPTSCGGGGAAGAARGRARAPPVAPQPAPRGGAPSSRRRLRSWVDAKSTALRLGMFEAPWGSAGGAGGAARPGGSVACKAGEAAEVAAAQEGDTDAADQEQPKAPPAPPPPAEEGWVPVLAEADLPVKGGSREQTSAGGYSMVLFWYKGAIKAIEARSPAEGAYSEGFMEAKLTQNDSIICPSTLSEFDLNTGEVRTWYPTNRVLSSITPQCRPMDVFQAQAAAGAIYVKLPLGAAEAAAARPSTAGGAGTSAEGDNIYGIEPKMYIDNPNDVIQDSSGAAAGADIDGGKLVGGVVLVALLGVVGTGYPLVTYEPPTSYAIVAAVWLVLFSGVAFFAAKTVLKDDLS